MCRKLMIIIFILVCSSTVYSATTASCGSGTVRISGGDVYYYGDSEGDPLPVYGGEHKPIAVASCGTGVVTVFENNKHLIHWAYYSPDCLKTGGGGDTKQVYDGDHELVSLSKHPDKGVVARWEKKGKAQSYHSPDCLNVGGGGKTVRY